MGDGVGEEAPKKKRKRKSREKDQRRDGGLLACGQWQALHQFQLHSHFTTNGNRGASFKIIIIIFKNGSGCVCRAGWGWL